MISTNDLSYGKVIKLDGEYYMVISAQHIKPGKGQAFVKTRLKNLKKGTVIEKNLKAGEKVEDVYIERKKMQYLYSADGEYVFMDTETYEQIGLSEDMIEEVKGFLKEGMEVIVQIFEEKPFGIELPTAVELKVVSTEPGVKGDTVSGGTKPAVLETGITINVPLFIKEGDIIKVDTRTKSYIERV